VKTNYVMLLPEDGGYIVIFSDKCDEISGLVRTGIFCTK
jgi:hypothetical protein